MQTNTVVSQELTNGYQLSQYRKEPNRKLTDRTEKKKADQRESPTKQSGDLWGSPYRVP